MRVSTCSSGGGCLWTSGPSMSAEPRLTRRGADAMPRRRNRRRAASQADARLQSWRVTRRPRRDAATMGRKRGATRTASTTMACRWSARSRTTTGSAARARPAARGSKGRSPSPARTVDTLRGLAHDTEGLRETTSVIAAAEEPAPAVGDADRDAARVLRERGDTGSVEHGPPAVPELAGFPAGEGLSVRRLEVGRQFTVECCRDDVTSPGADVDAAFIAKSREAVAQFGFDADLEHVCTSHDMTQQHAAGRVEPSALAEKCTLSDPGRLGRETRCPRFCGGRKSYGPGRGRSGYFNRFGG